MDLISGGYLLIKPLARAACFAAHLVRDPIVSASNCLQADCLPDTRWLSSGDRAVVMAAAARLGLSEAEGDRIQAWLEAGYRSNPPKVLWPSVFASIEALRELIGAIGRVPTGMIAIGIALPRELLPRLLVTEPEKTGSTEACGQLAAALPPTPGLDLGWEVLGNEAEERYLNVRGFHSWLCNGMEEYAHREFCIKPNGRGFIDSYDDAKRVAEYCDEVQPEPGVWLPWMVTQYNVP